MAVRRRAPVLSIRMVVAIAVSACLVLLGVVATAAPAFADDEGGPFGTELVSGSDWLTNDGGGVNVYSNGSISYVSPYSSGYGTEWQCVELAQRLWDTKGWYSGLFTSGGTDISYASQIYGMDHATPYANNGNYMPVPGDLIVEGGDPGHVAVVNYVSGTQVYVVEQNVDTDAESAPGQAIYTMTSSGLTRNESDGLSVSGIVHAPGDHYTNGTELVGDVTGDGKADAVVFDQHTGDWFVEPSSGSSFGSAQTWITGFGAGSTKQFLADVNGDGKLDAVAYWSGSGDYYVALSTGTGFSTPTRWSTGQIGTSDNQFMGDVNGDGYADAIVYSASSGNWYVALSNGSNGFGSFSEWLSGVGVGSVSQFVADVTGDGKADAVAYYGNVSGYAGDFYVAPSTGSAFGTASQWSSGQISSSTNQMLGDVTGDGKADAIAGVFNSSAGTWYASPSDGSSSFTGFSQWTSGDGAGSEEQFVADVTGDGKADAVYYFGGDNGWWYVAPSTGSAFGSASRWASGFGVGSS